MIMIKEVISLLFVHNWLQQYSCCCLYCNEDGLYGWRNCVIHSNHVQMIVHLHCDIVDLLDVLDL